MYVIKRTDQGGGYVARQGSNSSYTHNLELARKFHSREAANAERCEGNEIVLSVDDILRY